MAATNKDTGTVCRRGWKTEWRGKKEKVPSHQTGSVEKRLSRQNRSVEKFKLGTSTAYTETENIEEKKKLESKNLKK